MYLRAKPFNLIPASEEIEKTKLPSFLMVKPIDGGAPILLDSEKERFSGETVIIDGIVIKKLVQQLDACLFFIHYKELSITVHCGVESMYISSANKELTIESMEPVKEIIDLIEYLNMVQTREFLRPLQDAMKYKKAETIQWILNRQSLLNLNIINKDGTTYLHSAVLEDNMVVMLDLLKHGADVLIYNYDGLLAFHLAIKLKRYQAALHLMKHLCERFACDYPGDLTVRDSQATALMYALQSWNDEKALAEIITFSNNIDIGFVHLAMHRQLWNSALQMIKQQPNLAIARFNGMLPLHGAIKLKNIPLTMSLLDLAPSPWSGDLKDGFGRSALMLAFLEWPDITDLDHQTSQANQLSWSKNIDIRLADLAMDHQMIPVQSDIADVDQTSNQTSQTRAISRLIRWSKNIDIRLVHLAIERQLPNLALQMITQQPDLAITPFKGMLPLHVAINLKNIDLTMTLLNLLQCTSLTECATPGKCKYQWPGDLKDDYGRSALMLALLEWDKSLDEEVVQVLQYSSSLTDADQSGDTALKLSHLWSIRVQKHVQMKQRGH